MSNVKPSIVVAVMISISPCLSLIGLFPLLCCTLGPVLHTKQLMFPVALERRSPFVHGPNRLGVRLIEHAATVTPHADEANVSQNTKVFRDGRLLDTQGGHNVPDGPFLRREIDQYFPAERIADGIESVRCRSCSGHV